VREEAFRALRRARDARTRFARVAMSFSSEAKHPANESIRWLLGDAANDLLWLVLSDAEMLVDVLNDDAAEKSERYARDLYLALRARRLAAQLAEVEGRTPEEAQAFRDKSRELRGKRFG